jgi:site-specific recombinase XerD
MTDRLPDVMTDQEWRAFVLTFNRKAPTGLRNAALVTIMHDAGLRSCEVIGLKTSDIREETLDGRMVTALRLETTKGGKERMAYLTPEADGLLRRWLETRRVRKLAQCKHVFCTLTGEPLAGAYLRELVARKGAEAGIAWRVHPHALRHTFGTDLLERTGDLALVQDALGHSSPETTRVYARVRSSRLARAMVGEEGEQEEEVQEGLPEGKEGERGELARQVAALEAQVAELTARMAEVTAVLAGE